MMMLKTTSATLLPLLFGLVSGRHFFCNWKPTGGKEPGSDWTQFCSGKTAMGGNEYKCGHEPFQFTVATYQSDKNNLEIGVRRAEALS